MTKKQNKTARGNGPRPKIKKNKKTGRVRQNRSVPRGVVEHAQMLMDPCHAKLAHPLYTGGGSGTLMRFTSYTSVGTLAGQTAACLIWTPGSMSAGGQDPTLMVMGADSLTTNAAFALAGDRVPGYSFLTSAQVDNYRCVAACMDVTPNASVMNRSGRVYKGLCTAIGPWLNATANIRADTWVPMFSEQGDAADEHAIYWRPAHRDQAFQDANLNIAARDVNGAGSLDGHCSFGYFAGGMTAGTGHTVRMTAIYEVQLSPKFGTAYDMTRARSDGTLDDVLNFVEDVGFKYVSTMAGPAAGMITRGISQVARKVFST